MRLTKQSLQDFSDFEVERFFCFGGGEYCTAHQIQSFQQKYTAWNLFPQAGQKDVRGMKEAFTYVFDQGFKKIVLIGTDIYWTGSKKNSGDV